jgi:hypothetical protein
LIDTVKTHSCSQIVSNIIEAKLAALLLDSFNYSIPLKLELLGLFFTALILIFLDKLVILDLELLKNIDSSPDIFNVGVRSWDEILLSCQELFDNILINFEISSSQDVQVSTNFNSGLSFFNELINDGFVLQQVLFQGDNFNKHLMILVLSHDHLGELVDVDHNKDY